MKTTYNRFEEVIASFSNKAVLPIPFSLLKEEEKRKEMKEQKNLIAFSFYNTSANLMSIDVLMEAPLSFNEMWKEKVVRKADDTEINLVSVEHLI